MVEMIWVTMVGASRRFPWTSMMTRSSKMQDKWHPPLQWVQTRKSLMALMKMLMMHPKTAHRDKDQASRTTPWTTLQRIQVIWEHLMTYNKFNFDWVHRRLLWMNQLHSFRFKLRMMNLRKPNPSSVDTMTARSMIKSYKGSFKRSVILSSEKRMYS